MATRTPTSRVPVNAPDGRYEVVSYSGSMDTGDRIKVADVGRGGAAVVHVKARYVADQALTVYYADADEAGAVGDINTAEYDSYSGTVVRHGWVVVDLASNDLWIDPSPASNTSSFACVVTIRYGGAP